MLETIAVLAVVGAAALFVGRRAWRAITAARSTKNGCGTDCGCGH